MAETIKVDGLKEFIRAIKALDADLPKAVRVGLNEAAAIIVDYAKPKVPRRTGRAAAAIRPQSTAKLVRITEGGKRAPYMPWLDFGGTIRPRGQTKHRPFIKDGRFLYAGLADRREQVLAKVQEVLVAAATSAGVEVD